MGGWGGVGGDASNKTHRIHAQTLNTEPLREHGAPLLALIHFKMQMGGFEIQPVCVMLGYFNVVSMLGIILSTAGGRKKKTELEWQCPQSSSYCFQWPPNEIRPVAALSPNPPHSDGA